MILELDCGNSFIKWRLFDFSTNSSILQGRVLYIDEIETVFNSFFGKVSACRLVSVRSNTETSNIYEWLVQFLGVPVLQAQSSTYLAGVTNGYKDHAKLGLDRWMAIVGAYNHCKKACAVFDLGTALTVDWVSSTGRHLGGFIVPGLDVMLDSLDRHAQQISCKSLAGQIASTEDCLLPGLSTSEGIEHGCIAMLRSFIAQQVSLLNKEFKCSHNVYLIGGGAPLIKPVFDSIEAVDDLIFLGLALACPFYE
ncbi:UNVERIFIED_CONTAM: hypothetical protein GTU68_033755 [Idotea baltica]|nr:hypothetical protein [Idotea baltica]